jgi:hypothetical protein
MQLFEWAEQASIAKNWLPAVRPPYMPMAQPLPSVPGTLLESAIGLSSYTACTATRFRCIHCAQIRMVYVS